MLRMILPLAKENPTGWKEEVDTSVNYLEKMLNAKPGNVVVISGNNKLKTEYIKKSVEAGLNVLADKPMAISRAGFDELKQAFAEAKEKNVLLYDIMTSRYEITHPPPRCVACDIPGSSRAR